jgi:hypothetical protein
MTFPSRQATLLLICRRIVHRVRMRKKSKKRKNERKKIAWWMYEWTNMYISLWLKKRTAIVDERIYIYIYISTLAHWTLSFDSTDSSPNSRICRWRTRENSSHYTVQLYTRRVQPCRKRVWMYIYIYRKEGKSEF